MGIIEITIIWTISTESVYFGNSIGITSGAKNTVTIANPKETNTVIIFNFLFSDTIGRLFNEFFIFH